MLIWEYSGLQSYIPCGVRGHTNTEESRPSPRTTILNKAELVLRLENKKEYQKIATDSARIQEVSRTGQKGTKVTESQIVQSMMFASLGALRKKLS